MIVAEASSRFGSLADLISMRPFEKPRRDDLDHVDEAVSLVIDDEIEMRLELLLFFASMPPDQD